MICTFEPNRFSNFFLIPQISLQVFLPKHVYLLFQADRYFLPDRFFCFFKHLLLLCICRGVWLSHVYTASFWPLSTSRQFVGKCTYKKSRQIQSQLNWTCRLCKTICNCNIWLTVWAFLYFYDISIFNTISLYKIVHYSLSYSGFSVFPVPRSKATTTVTLCTSIFSLWFSPILLKPKNSTKCVNSRISRYLSFVVPPPSPHEQSSQIDQPGILF